MAGSEYDFRITDKKIVCNGSKMDKRSFVNYVVFLRELHSDSARAEWVRGEPDKLVRGRNGELVLSRTVTAIKNSRESFLEDAHRQSRKNGKLRIRFYYERDSQRDSLHVPAGELPLIESEFTSRERYFMESLGHYFMDTNFNMMLTRPFLFDDWITFDKILLCLKSINMSNMKVLPCRTSQIIFIYLGRFNIVVDMKQRLIKRERRRPPPTFDGDTGFEAEREHQSSEMVEITKNFNSALERTKLWKAFSYSPLREECPSCKKIGSRSNFCGDCGHKKHRDKPTREECPHCKKIGSRSKFCIDCGESKDVKVRLPDEEIGFDLKAFSKVDPQRFERFRNELIENLLK